MEPEEDRLEAEKRIRAEAARESKAFFWKAFAIALAIWILYTLVTGWASKWNWSSVGVFGDAFGALTSLFTCLTLAGTVYAVLMQREELELQRDEMRRGWAELKAQTTHLATQAKALKETQQMQQRELHANSRPLFVCNSPVLFEPDRILIRFYNSGYEISKVSVLVNDPKEATTKINRSESWDSGEEGHIELFGQNIGWLSEVCFSIIYTDRLFRKSESIFRLEHKGKPIDITPDPFTPDSGASDPA